MLPCCCTCRTARPGARHHQHLRPLAHRPACNTSPIAAPRLRQAKSDSTKVCLQDEGDADFAGVRDQLAVALLATHGSAALHDAALAAIDALSAVCGVTAAQVLGERWAEPWIDMRGISLYTVPLVAVRAGLRSMQEHTCCCEPNSMSGLF